jgi:hypothetical protein
MYSYTGYNWSHWNCNGKLKEKPVSCTGKTLDRLTAADSCTGNSTDSAESAVVWGAGTGGLRGVPGRKGLWQETTVIIIIIIIIIIGTCRFTGLQPTPPGADPSKRCLSQRLPFRPWRTVANNHSESIIIVRKMHIPSASTRLRS